ncbi:MAG: hypothetical protein ABIH03_13885 [Pseudomonadota bacterium]
MELLELVGVASTYEAMIADCRSVNQRSPILKYDAMIDGGRSSVTRIAQHRP